MQPRRIARELAFLCLTQLVPTEDKKKPAMIPPETLSDAELSALLHRVIVFLREECEETLEQATMQVQQSHEALLQSDIGARDITSAREKLTQAVNLTQQAINTLGATLELPERLLLADHPEVRPLTLALIRTYLQQQPRIEEVIKKAMVGWSWDRLGRIEQAMLHLSVTEILGFEDIPVKVSISEIVELTKRYGGETSPAFVNGVLRRVLQTLEPAT